LGFPAILALIVASPPQENAMKDAISYIRVSSEEQADSGLGLEAQRQRIAAYCAMKGLHLAEVFEDPGISAGKPLASRPAGGKLLVAAKKRKAVVVVAKLDRLLQAWGTNRGPSHRRDDAGVVQVIAPANPPGVRRVGGPGREPAGLFLHGASPRVVALP
jgi:hypothetical protein